VLPSRRLSQRPKRAAVVVVIDVVVTYENGRDCTLSP
jgi:hypothetical protein